MPSRSKGRRTFVGLTVHGRTEGRLESHLQSSPAEGITVTKAEVKPRGDHSFSALRARARGGEYEGTKGPKGQRDAALALATRTLAEHELDAPRPEGQWENVPISRSMHDVLPRGKSKHMLSFTCFAKARASIHGAAGHCAVVRSCASRSSRKSTCSPLHKPSFLSILCVLWFL